MKRTALIDRDFSPPGSTARALLGGTPFSVEAPAGLRRRIARAWLMLGIAALVASGVFSVLLVLARAPLVKDLLPAGDFFRVALVVHVDLAVLVWFVAFAGVLWTLNGRERFMELDRLALALCALGTAMMSVAPFVSAGEPIMANYVPVIQSPLFLAGLCAFGAGFAALTFHALLAAQRIGFAPDGAAALRFGLNTSAVAAAMAILAFGASWAGMPEGYFGKPFYELLFWGPGHVIQFTWTLMMLVSWLCLATGSGLRVPLSPRLALLLFGIALVAVFCVPPIYLAWPIDAPEHVKMQTWLMRFGGGLAILPVVTALGVAIFLAPRADAAQSPLRAALLASMFLFALGGAFGFLINGNDVRVPAHYHGCIVGVTLALMGMTYALLPRLGFGTPDSRLARWQPWIYGAGQALHITGLVWSGGYGVQRKVAGAEQVLRTPQEVAGMGVMGFGGLVAIVGGLVFLIVVIRALREVRSEAGA